MSHFPRCMAFILKLEGPDSNHPDDNDGGGTSRGVTQITYDAWRRSVGIPVRPVRDADDEEVEVIYRTRYWHACRCDSLPGPIALMMFDAAVQHGPETAVEALQRIVGVKRDGDMGPMTIEAVRFRVKVVGASFVAVEIMSARVMDIYTRSSKWDEFGKGWTRRLAQVTMKAMMMDLPG